VFSYLTSGDCCGRFVFQIDQIALFVMSFHDCICLYIAANSVEIKTEAEADSNDINECAYDDMLNTGMCVSYDTVFFTRFICLGIRGSATMRYINLRLTLTCR